DFEANVPGFAADGPGGDHAGKVETSLLWELEPGCVDMSRIAPPPPPGRHFAMGADAGEASGAVGARMVADEVRWLGDKGRELLADYDRLPPAQRLATFAEVEALWDEVVRPRLPDFKSLASVLEGYGRL